jgi:hypothetical protein
MVLSNPRLLRSMSPHEMNPNDQNLHPALLLRSLAELKMPLTGPTMLVRVAI